jgi:SP family arabinose:H+ symporter-like MFS transporter
MAASTPLLAGDSRYVWCIAAVAAIGGLLFGYDTAVISGAIDAIRDHFSLSSTLKGWAASSALVGCIVGALLSGPAADRLGRRPSLLVCAVLFALSGLLSATATSFTAFICWRLAGGMAIGAVSLISPLYIAEVAPEAIRGRLVALYQLAIVTGISAVFFVNWDIQRHGSVAWNTDVGWRYMLGSLTVPAVLFFLCTLLIPESPRWLIRARRLPAALRILTRLQGPHKALESSLAIQAALQTETSSLAVLASRRFRRPLAIGIMLAVVCQCSGINAIMYYAPSIFAAASHTQDPHDADFLRTVIIGIVNLVFTFVAILSVDRFGRRPLLIAGSVVQVLALSATCWAMATNQGGALLLVPILVFIAAFACAMGPVPWIVISEIFPARVRGAAMAVATAALWSACYLVAQTFPDLCTRVGTPGAFAIYAGCSLVGLILVLIMVPETKGRSLEEIAAAWGTAS